MGHAAATSDHNCLAKINPTILRNADFIGTTCTSADGALAGEALPAAPIDEQTRTLRGLGRLEGALQVAAVAIQCWAVDTVCNARAIAGSAMVSRGDALDLLGVKDKERAPPAFAANDYHVLPFPARFHHPEGINVGELEPLALA
jgi:hypothetical protein